MSGSRFMMCLLILLLAVALSPVAHADVVPLTQSGGAAVSDSGFSGICLGCSISGLNDLTNDDLNTVTTISMPVGIAVSGFVCVDAGVTVPADSTAGFVGEVNGGLLGLINIATVETYLGGSLQESLTTTGLLVIAGLGNGANVAGEFSQPFDEICLELASLGSVLTTSTLNYGFYIQPGPGDADPAMSTLTASPPAITANGSSTSLITIEAHDSGGVPTGIGGDAITVSTTAGSITSSVTDHGNGVYTTLLTSSLQEETAVVTAVLNGQTMAASASVDFVSDQGGGASGMATLINAAPSVIAADGVATSQITVTARDAFGNALTAGGDSVDLATTGGSLSTVIDQGDGTYTATLTAPAAPGSAVVSGTINAEAIGREALVAFRAQVEADAAQSVLTAAPTQITADGLSTTLITVEARDSSGDPLTSGGDIVAVQTTGGTLARTMTDHGDGTYSTLLTSSTQVGTVTISGTLNGMPLGNTTDVTFIAGPPVRYAVTVSDPAPPAGAAITVQAQLLDTNDNPVPEAGRTVNWSATNGGSFSNGGVSQTNIDGMAEIVFTTAPVVDTEHVVTATDDDDPGLTGNSPTIVTGEPRIFHDRFEEA